MSKQVYLVWLVFFPHTYSVQQKPRWSWNGMAGEWGRVTASPSRRRTDGRWLERKTWCHLQETCLNSFPNFLPALNTFNLHEMINTQSGANLCRSHYHARGKDRDLSPQGCMLRVTLSREKGLVHKSTRILFLVRVGFGHEYCAMLHP